MKFIISATSVWDSLRTGEILKSYPLLSDYGYEVLEEPDTRRIRTFDTITGKTIWTETPCVRRTLCVNIDTLEQLMSLCEAVDEDLVIISAKSSGEKFHEIEIYDSWRE